MHQKPSFIAYGNEMTDADHRDLAEVLNRVSGRVAISNYAHPLMDQLYPAPKWLKILAPEKTIHSTKDIRQEALWVNFVPEGFAGKQTTMFPLV